MLFTSFGFILFLLALSAIYSAAPQKARWAVLLAGSFVFYAFSGFYCLVYISAVTALTYFFARGVGGLLERGRKPRAALPLALCVFIVSGLLLTLKLSAAFSSPISLLFPMGISFYALKTIGYVTDVYRGTCKAEKNIFKYALFVSFFPQLVQGPISRFKDISPSLFEGRPFEFERTASALWRIIWGFFKKLVVADRLMPAVRALSAEPEIYTGIYFAVLMLFYMITLFADFTGGIDIALGVSELFGVETAENFDRPYLAASISEFWRRWHITMGTWFRDYVFYPLSASRFMGGITKKLSRSFSPRTVSSINVSAVTLLVWFLTGLWHGAKSGYIVWGLLNGLIIVATLNLKPRYAAFHKRWGLNKKSWYKAFCVVRTFLLMSCIQVFDCFSEASTTFRMFASLFAPPAIAGSFFETLTSLGPAASDYIVVALACALFAIAGFSGKTGEVRKKLSAKSPVFSAFAAMLLLLFVIVFGSYGIGYDSSQFIYNGF
ncbi:MAG: MBOAT family O-acyltransferase [Oscillospiraceae bacterium]|nr:MBOAT family O-acyltransferase [Oscillospiraceae bacterium]